jgi:hypothetical protein
MAAHSSNGAAPVLELKPKPRTANGHRRKAPRILSPVTEVHETPTDLVIRVRLQQGALELSVPKRALCDTRPAPKNVVPGGNPDATAC